MSDEGTQATNMSILQKRAENLAAFASDRGEEDREAAVILRLGQERYVIALEAVDEVMPLDLFRPLPGMASFVAGILNLRGRIVSVLDLSVVLGGSPVQRSDSARVILLRCDGEPLGLLVDELVGTGDYNREAVSRNSLHSRRKVTRYALGLSSKREIVLDAQRLIEAEELIVDDEPTALRHHVSERTFS